MSLEEAVDAEREALQSLPEQKRIYAEARPNRAADERRREIRAENGHPPEGVSGPAPPSPAAQPELFE